jgi:hypothetical protein
VRVTPLAERVGQLDWPRIETELDAQGWATTDALLTAAECTALAALYANEGGFRSRVLMARHGYGRGEYKYFDTPLPLAIDALRTAFYPRLAPVANRWQQSLRAETRFPPTLEQMLARCHAAGQRRPTPLLLKYQQDDYNCLHQDLYGEQVFPLQLALLLSQPGTDFEGGEFVLTEQRPRMQSRAQVVPLAQGEAVIFAVHHRPVQGARGTYRVNLRHGVSRLRSGERYTAGLIFHDAA